MGDLLYLSEYSAELGLAKYKCHCGREVVLIKQRVEAAIATSCGCDKIVNITKQGRFKTGNKPYVQSKKRKMK